MFTRSVRKMNSTQTICFFRSAAFITPCTLSLRRHLLAVNCFAPIYWLNEWNSPCHTVKRFRSLRDLRNPQVLPEEFVRIIKSILTFPEQQTLRATSLKLSRLSSTGNDFLFPSLITEKVGSKPTMSWTGFHFNHVTKVFIVLREQQTCKAELSHNTPSISYQDVRRCIMRQMGSFLHVVFVMWRLFPGRYLFLSVYMSTKFSGIFHLITLRVRFSVVSLSDYRQWGNLKDLRFN